MGFDPSAPDIHLGHAVGLRKLRQLQELGHKLVLIVGDWDGADRRSQRPLPDAKDAERRGGAPERRDLHGPVLQAGGQGQDGRCASQSEWFGEFSLNNVIELTSRFTVAQILERDDFASRYKANQPIAITELLYPLLQAYDSVPIESDVEFGGTDQKFNLLVGRDLQQMMGMPLSSAS